MASYVAPKAAKKAQTITPPPSLAVGLIPVSEMIVSVLRHKIIKLFVSGFYLNNLPRPNCWCCIMITDSDNFVLLSRLMMDVYDFCFLLLSIFYFKGMIYYLYVFFSLLYVFS